nr:nac domain-containing protein 14 [Quercus suber]
MFSSPENSGDFDNSPPPPPPPYATSPFYHDEEKEPADQEECASSSFYHDEEKEPDQEEYASSSFYHDEDKEADREEEDPEEQHYLAEFLDDLLIELQDDEDDEDEEPAQKQQNCNFGTQQYPKGKRPILASGNGYWKAMGDDKEIKSKEIVVGYKKKFVFHRGNPLSGDKTNWIMKEYRITHPPIERNPRIKNGERIADFDNPVSKLRFVVAMFSSPENSGDFDDSPPPPPPPYATSPFYHDEEKEPDQEEYASSSFYHDEDKEADREEEDPEEQHYLAEFLDDLLIELQDDEDDEDEEPAQKQQNCNFGYKFRPQ